MQYTHTQVIAITVMRNVRKWHLQCFSSHYIRQLRLLRSSWSKISWWRWQIEVAWFNRSLVIVRRYVFRHRSRGFQISKSWEAACIQPWSEGPDTNLIKMVTRLKMRVLISPSASIWWLILDTDLHSLRICSEALFCRIQSWRSRVSNWRSSPKCSLTSSKLASKFLPLIALMSFWCITCVCPRANLLFVLCQGPRSSPLICDKVSRCTHLHKNLQIYSHNHMHQMFFDDRCCSAAHWFWHWSTHTYQLL